MFNYLKIVIVYVFRQIQTFVFIYMLRHVGINASANAFLTPFRMFFKD